MYRQPSMIFEVELLRDAISAEFVVEFIVQIKTGPSETYYHLRTKYTFFEVINTLTSLSHVVNQRVPAEKFYRHHRVARLRGCEREIKATLRLDFASDCWSRRDRSSMHLHQDTSPCS